MRAPAELHFSLDEFAARLAALRQRMVAAGIDVLLLTTPEDKTAVDAAKAVHALLAEAGLKATIGMGGHYAKANGLRWSYFEARDAVARGLPVNEPERLSLTSLLLASEDVPLSDMAMETLKPLYDFDAAHGAGLADVISNGAK